MTSITHLEVESLKVQQSVVGVHFVKEHVSEMRHLTLADGYVSTVHLCKNGICKWVAVYSDNHDVVDMCISVADLEREETIKQGFI